MTRSYFFRLPRELRDQVYDLVLGQRLVHVQSESFMRFRERGSPREIYQMRQYYDNELEEGFAYIEMVYTNALTLGECYEPMTEQQAYDVSQQVTFDDPFGLRPKCKGPVKNCRYCKRHSKCWARGFDMVVNRREISLLRVSGDVHREAEAILYRNTTFSFNLAHTMKTFVQSLDPTQMHQIKTVHLHMSRDAESSSWSWDSDDIPNTMKMLTNLTALHISILPTYLGPSEYVNQAVDTGTLTNYFECVDMLQRGALSWWKADLALFRHPKLRCVTVIVEDDSRCPLYSTGYDIQVRERAMRRIGYWTIAERAKLARLLEEKLLTSWNAISADAEIANSAHCLEFLSDDSRPE